MPKTIPEKTHTLSLLLDDGKVLKAVNLGLDNKGVIIEELRVLPNIQPITNIALMPVKQAPHTLVVLSPHEVVSIPIHRCREHATSCR